MSKRYLAPKLGQVTFPSGFNMDTQSFTVTESQNVEDITVYGAMLYAQNRGSGTPRQEVSAIGFGHTQSGSSTFGFSNMAAAGGDVGATATFVFDQPAQNTAFGSTYAAVTGVYVVRQIRVEHSRVVAAVRCAIDLTNAGDISVQWAA